MNFELAYKQHKEREYKRIANYKSWRPALSYDGVVLVLYNCALPSIELDHMTFIKNDLVINVEEEAPIGSLAREHIDLYREQELPTFECFEQNVRNITIYEYFTKEYIHRGKQKGMYTPLLEKCGFYLEINTNSVLSFQKCKELGVKYGVTFVGAEKVPAKLANKSYVYYFAYYIE